MLSKNEIHRIYLFTSAWYSQRDIAKLTWHSRWTISKYLKTDNLLNEYFYTKYEVKELEWKKFVLEERNKEYKKMLITTFIVVFIQALIIIFI